MEKSILYTIGHGSRKVEELLALLEEFEIKYLIDVRSRPYSRFHPQYNQNALQNSLEKNSIKYVFMGDELGGRPLDASCYNEKGNVDYGIIRTKDFFKRGIDRLKTACGKGIPAAIMCSERDPAHCHRTRLIGEVLNNEGILLKHIDAQGKLKEHVYVMNELRKKNSTVDLFSSGAGEWL
jgi:uncharacterized protein (DUF488 family)